jgi:hypothetical protein
MIFTIKYLLLRIGQEKVVGESLNPEKWFFQEIQIIQKSVNEARVKIMQNVDLNNLHFISNRDYNVHVLFVGNKNDK